MADETTTGPEGDVSKKPSGPQTGSPATMQGDSAFLGKQAPPKPLTPLNVPEQIPSVRTSTQPLTPIQLPQQMRVAAMSPAPTPTRVAAPKPTPEDILHGGNVISLLEQEAKKKGELPPEPAIEAAPTETPIQRSIREMGLEPRPEKIIERQQEVKKKEHDDTRQNGLPRIRTYASDMSEEIRKRGETLSTIISAEREKMGRGPIGSETAAKRESVERPTQNVLFIAGAGLLLLIGLAAIVLSIFLTREPSMETTHAGLLPANHVVFVTADQNVSLIALLTSEKATAELSLGEIQEIVLTENGIPVSAERLLNTLGAPSVLARNATDSMVGLHAFDRTQPFFLISVSAYDRAFEGMLEWENQIAFDLGSLFAPSRLQGNEIFATPPTMEFSDRVFQNIDVRETPAAWKILYAFPRRDLLLITTNENTLKEIMARLSVSGN